MANIFLLNFSFALGIFFRRLERFPFDTPKVLNAFIIHISLPALILLYIPQLDFEPSLLVLILMPWILFLFAFLLMNFLGKIYNFDRTMIGALILISGLGNTSFVGLSMIESFYGKDFIKYGLLIDQGGTSFALSTLGILVAIKYSQGGKISYHEIVKKILTFPPFTAFILSLFLKEFYQTHLWKDFVYKEEFFLFLRKLGDTLPPLALFSVGFQVKLSEAKNYKAPIMIALLYKLIISPLITIFIIYYFFDLKKNIYHILIFQEATGPMITASIVAINYNLRPPFVKATVAIGIILSFFTLPLFWYFFH